MSLRSFLRVFCSDIGDVVLNALQSASIGSSFGNGAASFAANTAGPNFSSNPNPLQIGESGNIGLIVNNPAVNPTSTAADIVVGFFTLPAGALDIAGRQVDVTAVFTHAANTDTVTYKLQVTQTLPVLQSAISGGTVIASAADGTSSAVSQIGASIAKYGAAGSNTQLAVHESSQVGATVTALTAPTPLTLNESEPIYVAVTINCASTDTDGALSLAQLTASN